MNFMLDAIDSKAIAALQQDGRASWADLGTALGLSAPAAAERVRKLIDGGLVRGFTAVLDPETAGFPVLAFVAVTLERAGRAPAFLDGVRRAPADPGVPSRRRRRRLPAQGAGAQPRANWNRSLADELKGRLGIARTRTTIVLGTAKETVRLPVGAPAAPATGARPRAARRKR